MHRKRLAFLTALAMVAGLFAFAVPAQATHLQPDDVQQFMPLDNTSDFGNSKDQLSDQFDGVDDAAHLTVVATRDTDQVTWYVCIGGEQPFEDAGSNQVQRNVSCDEIGTDTEGRQPAGADEHAIFADEAYEFFWNIPQNLDGTRRDIVALACIGAPGTADQEDPGNDVPDNCNQDVQANILLEDSSDEDDLIAGELVAICTAEGSNQGVGDPDNRCITDSTGDPIPVANRPFNEDVAEHGGNVPEDGFTLRWRTSSDVSNSGVCIISPADAETAPALANAVTCVTGTAEETRPTFTQWVASFSDGQIPDDAEIDIAIFGLGSGGSTTAECSTFGAGLCFLDEHYVISTERLLAEIVLTWDADDDGAFEDQCASPVTEVSQQLDDPHWGYMCATDQFDDPFPAAGDTGDFTLESNGPEGSGFTNCSGGTSHDHDGDGRAEHCHVDETDTIQTGVWRFRVDNFSGTPASTTATPGQQTVTGCEDAEAFGGTLANPPANHGCGDESPTASILKNWATAPTSVELVFNVAGADPQQTCLTGDKFRENQVNDQDELLACTFDANGNFTSTEPAGSGRLQWFIAPSGGGELTATRFEGNPPNETGPDGTVTTLIEAFREGNDTITVALQNDPGGNAGSDSASVQKRVTQTGQTTTPPDGVDPGDARGLCSSENAGQTFNITGGGQVIVGTPNDDALTGTQEDDVICGLGGHDDIKGFGGNDQLLGGGGNDTIGAGSGNDNVRGGGGHDLARGGRGRDQIRGGRGNDELSGGRGRDNLRAGRGHDTLNGQRGTDIMRAARGNDLIRDVRGRGNVLRGGPGTDTCVAKANRDNVFGGCEKRRLV